MPKTPYRRFIIIFVGLIIISLTSRAQSLTQSDLISTFRPWRVEHVTLSPDGTHLACSINDEDSTSIEILDINHPEKPVLLKVEENRLGSHWWSMQASARRVSFISWSGNQHLIVLSNLDGLFVVNSDGTNPIKLGDSVSLGYTEYPKARISNINKSGKENSKGSTSEFRNDEPEPRLVPRKLNVLWVPKTETPWITVSASGKETDVYRINIQTGAKEVIFSEVGTKSTLLADHTGTPRLELIDNSTEAVRNYRLINIKDKEKVKRFESIATPVTPKNALNIRSIPTALDINPDIVYYASNADSKSYALYKMDLNTGTKTCLSTKKSTEDIIDPLKAFDTQRLVFNSSDDNLAGIRYPDNTTEWINPEIAIIQSKIEHEIPHRTITILEWDKTHEHFLFTSSSTHEPGRYFLYTKSTNEIIQYFRRAPWIDTETLCPAEDFTVTLKNNTVLNGIYTEAVNPKVTPPPLIIILHDGPALRDKSDYDREAQLFAYLGISVARINYRGSSGKGLSYQNDSIHTLSQSISEDIFSSISYLSNHKKIDTKRIILLGNGFGGTLALRTLQLNPGRFKGAITINAPTDIAEWINTPTKEVQNRKSNPNRDSFSKKGGKGGKMNMKQTMQEMSRGSSRQPQSQDFEQLLKKYYFNFTTAEFKALSPIAHVSDVKDPVLMIQDLGGRPVTADQEQNFIEQLKPENNQAYSYEMEGNLYAIEPEARLNAYRAIEQFLNITLYNYSVNVGEIKEKN